MGKTFSDMKYSWILTNFGSSQKRCCLYPLQKFSYYFILIVFFGGPTVKPCSNLCFSSGDVFVKKPVNKYEEAQLQLQDLNSAKLNQTSTSSIQRTNEQASTSQPGMSMKKNIVQIYRRQDCIKKIGGIYYNTPTKQTFQALRLGRETCKTVRTMQRPPTM